MKIKLKLINGERKNLTVLSAKACWINSNDHQDCDSTSKDVCIVEDYVSCTIYSNDYCKYIDNSACTAYSNDICEYDNYNCGAGNNDTV